jgi:hypothetical protein
MCHFLFSGASLVILERFIQGNNVTTKPARHKKPKTVSNRKRTNECQIIVEDKGIDKQVNK